MSLATSQSIFGKLFGAFKPKDPLKREIAESINTIEKMLRALEITKKSLETISEEHKKRLKITESDRELSRIIEEEVRNVRGYIDLIAKSIYDLMRIKYRLETIFYVEEPLKILPEVLEELKNLEPVIEKVNPQLLSQVRMLEQRVAGILAMSSIGMPTIQQTYSSGQQIEERAKHAEVQVTTRAEKEPQVARDAALASKDQQLPAQVSIHASSAPQAPISQVISVPLSVVEQWILHELSITAGILDVRAFEKKYGVSRDTILEALKSLEAKNLVKVKRW
jgi:hypothetical protein